MRARSLGNIAKSLIPALLMSLGDGPLFGVAAWPVRLAVRLVLYFGCCLLALELGDSLQAALRQRNTKGARPVAETAVVCAVAAGSWILLVLEGMAAALLQGEPLTLAILPGLGLEASRIAEYLAGRILLWCYGLTQDEKFL